jgi:hypothetical protein
VSFYPAVRRDEPVSALEIFAAALLVLGSFIVLRVVVEADPLADPDELEAPPPDVEEEEGAPFRHAA